MRKGMAVFILLLLLVLAVVPASVAGPLPQGEGQEYVVKPGDYLGKLAEEYYNDATAWPAIWAATNVRAKTDKTYATIDDPNLVEVGEKLWIPDAKEKDQWKTANWAASARILERGVLACFASGLQDDEGNPINCETSAVAYDGTSVIMASDKPIPCAACSPVFAFPYAGTGLNTTSRTYYTAQPFVDAIKYEDMTVTPDGQYVVATTGFDRVMDDSAEWNGYNTLLVWPAGNPDAVQVVAASTVDGVTSSVDLRARFSQVLKNDQFPNGMPYFKAEGLAAIPGNKLLFGIRELGAKYDDFDYAVKIVSASYTIENGVMTLADDFTLVYDYKPWVRQQVALSSLEYDKYSDRLYILTSYETEATDEGLGGYLWTLSLADMNAGNAPAVVLKDPLTPLTFAHKAEGIAVLGKNRVLVIHDDDRVLGRETVTNPETQFSRAANQGAYTVVEFR